ncbi:MAG TPA: DUF1353 domain-containing protein [Ramlibacter sp.]|uniref:DUF1353 domain-containing protein n=1 Tax=Ramlibacter sp. TaxID=1917967 RepID=UPI002ED5C544
MSCIQYGTGYKYQLRRPHVERTGIKPDRPVVTDWIALDKDGTLTISAGYAWDGASGPTYDSKSSMRGSLDHDALYQLMRMGLLDHKHRAEADALFHRICREDGMWPPRAWLWHLAVRVFADPASDPANAVPDQCAPCDCPCPSSLA